MRPLGRGEKRESAAKKGQAARWTYDGNLRFLKPRRGRRPERDLAWLGVGVPDGVLVRLLNVPSRGRQFALAYQHDGWPGLQVSIALDDRIPDATKVRGLLEAAQFARARWTVAWCEHPRPHPQRVRQGTKHWRALPPLVHGQHWYVRPNRGRRPLACFLAREASKKARARAAPSQARQGRPKKTSLRR